MYPFQALQHVFGREQQSVAAGQSVVLDVRGARGIVAFGSATVQPCDRAGAVVPGSAAEPLGPGVPFETMWTHYRLVGGSGGCTVAVV
jgi:hypothetical protein